jgi:PAS domain S-box-containing protein
VTERPSLDDPEVYRMLVEGIPAIVYVDETDELSTNFYTSPQAVELLGYTQEEWATIPDLWITNMHPDDRERVLEENRRSNRDLDRFFCEYRMVSKDGRLVWLRDEATIVSGENGEALYWRGLMLDITAEKEAEEKLRRSMEALRRTIQQRRELAVRLEGAQEAERRRIAADIHDDPIQVMSAVDLRLQMLAAHPGKVTVQELDELHETVQLSIERLRSLLFELRPPSLDREGLLVAIREYVEYSSTAAGWTVAVDDRLDAEPPDDIRSTLYRIVQEAVTNARKHANASRIEVAVASVGDGVLVKVVDDGRGSDAEELERRRPGHLGLETIRERAELAGGWSRVNSVIGEGTSVECWLPIDGVRDT